MKNHRRSKQSSGFTLVEVLATVAILVILLAVSAVSVVKHIDVLKITELDNAARDIYMAAENRAVLLSGAQRLDALVPQKTGNKVTPTSPAQTLAAGDGETEESSLYFVSKADLKEDTKDLLIDGSIDPALMDGDFYIVYDMASGSVKDVFYAEKDSDAPAGALAALVDENGFDNFYTAWTKDRSARLKLRDGDDGVKNKNRTLVGHYSGEADGAAPWTDDAGTDIQERPYINVAITNKEELTVTVTVKWGKAIDSAVRAAIFGDSKYTPTLSVKLDDTNIDLADKLTFNQPIGSSNGRVEGEAMPESIYEEEENIYTYTCTWVLDSLTGGGTEGKEPLHFQDLGSGITPGKDFKVTATIKPVNKDDINYSFVEASAEATSNSLFEYWVEADGDGSNGEVAHIAYLRHLQNLSTSFSGVNKDVEPEDEATITSAVQTAHIWGNGNGGVDWNGTGERIPVLSDYEFAPIVNDELTSYSGLYSYKYNDRDLKPQYEIRELTVSGTDYVGLFGRNTEICTIENVIMVDCSVEGDGDNVGGIVGENLGTVQNCSNIATVTDEVVNGTVTGGNNVGGIVGYNYGAIAEQTATVAGCTNESEVTATGNNVGGIVGYNYSNRPGKALVTGCTNEGVVSAENSSFVGGVVGLSKSEFQASSKVENCHNTKSVTGGSYVGGIVGQNSGHADDGTAEVSGCWNKGSINSKSQYAGGVVGHSSKTVVNCYNIGNVHGAQSVGGVVGCDYGIGGLVKNCYNVGMVSADTEERAGSVLGNIGGNADVSHCYYLTGTLLKNNGEPQTDRGIREQDDSPETADQVQALTYTDFFDQEMFEDAGWDFTGKPNEEPPVPAVWTLECPYEGDGEDTCPGYEEGLDETLLSRPILVAIPEHNVPHAEPVNTIALAAGPVYYEKYDENGYGLHGYDADTEKKLINTLDTTITDSERISEDGYAVIVSPSELGKLVDNKTGTVTITYGSDTYTATVSKTDDTYTYTWTKGEETDATDPGEVIQVTVEGDNYYLIPLPDDLKSSAPGYTPLTVGEDEYYFNPDFAMTVETANPYENTTPAYTIRTARHLNNLSVSEQEYYNQAGYTFNQDLNLTLDDDNYDHKPIGAFSGTYDGGGHTISGLTISLPEDADVGLFASNSGNIRDLIVSGSVTGSEHVGGIVGSNSGMVENCSFSGTVSGSDKQVGGIVGSNNNGGEVTGCGNTGGTVTFTYDGNDDNGNDVGGVVGRNSGTVTNCYNTATVVATGVKRVGGVVGFNDENAKLSDCYNEGDVTGTNAEGNVTAERVGGIAGQNSSTVFQNCYNTGNVTGKSDVGGVVGDNCKDDSQKGNVGTVTNCYNTGTVTGSSNVGGVVGDNSEDENGTGKTGTVRNCYNTGTVTCTQNGVEAGGVVGKNSYTKDNVTRVGTVTNCYYLEGTATYGIGGNSADNGNNNGAAPLAEFEFSKPSTFAAWNFNTNSSAWVMAEVKYEDDGPVDPDEHDKQPVCYRPILDSNREEGLEPVEGDGDAYLIMCAEALADLSKKVNEVDNYSSNKTFKLTADIDLFSVCGEDVNEDGVSWTPIGTNGTNFQFKGTFDGNGKTITGLYINAEGSNYQGLFGYNTGTIRNVTVVDGSVTGQHNVGGLVGYNAGTVENCTYSGDVEGVGAHPATGTQYGVGGLVGYNTKTITDSLFTGGVTGEENVGGIVGYNNQGTVTGCENTCSVTGGNEVGGIVGSNRLGTVESCSFSGTVSGATNVGGIAGSTTKTVKDCGNSGEISGSSFVGGIAGNNGFNTAMVENCTNTGPISGSSRVGGIVGNNIGTVLNCGNTADITSTPDNTAGEYLGGVLGHNSGTVSDCWNEGNVYVPKSQYVGGVAGTNNAGGKLERCYNTGNITGDTTVGGVGGQNRQAKGIELCYNTGNVEGSSTLGGIVGTVHASPVINCYNTGNVEGSGGTIGGIVGSGNNEVTNCYNIGEVTGTGSNIGGVVGQNNSGTVTNCYYLDENDSGSVLGGIKGADVEGQAEAKTAEEFGRAYTAAAGGEDAVNDFGWTFDEDDGPWWMYVDTNVTDTDTQPLYRPGLVKNLEDGLREREKTVEISTAQDLVDFGNRVNEGDYYLNGILMDDITLTGEWKSIGTSQSKSFRGVFNGGGHTISELKVNSTSDNQGLFGYVRGGTVKNVTVEGEVAGGSNVGGVVGQNSGGTVENCHSSVTVTGNGYIGGVVGRNSGTVTGCTSSGSVNNIKGTYTGGIVGLNSGAVTGCTNNGTVESVGTYVGGVVGTSEGAVTDSCNKGAVSSAESYVGGVVGRNTAAGEVSGCWNEGTVSSKDDNEAFKNYVGGVAGDNRNTIDNCYNTGMVEGNERIGGIAGESRGSVTYCYNFGEVKGNQYIGGVVGMNQSAGTVTGCYYLGNKAAGGIGKKNSSNGDDTYGAAEKKTADDFKTQDTFTDWDFENIWEMGEGADRPTLQNNPEDKDATTGYALSGDIIVAANGPAWAPAAALPPDRLKIPNPDDGEREQVPDFD